MKKEDGSLRDVKNLVLFGTGWGLTDGVLESADFRLGPILSKSEDGYNHLSVRSAVAIYLSQL